MATGLYRLAVLTVLTVAGVLPGSGGQPLRAADEALLKSPPPKADTAAETDSGSEHLLQQLDAGDFQARLAASRQLQDLSAERIPEIAELAVSHSSAEVSARLLDFLERQYLSAEPAASEAASAALEQLADSARLLVAETAQEILDRNWQVRVELAARQLSELGAILQRSDESVRMQAPPAGFRGPLPPTGLDDVKVFLTEDYQGGREGLQLFERMAALIGSRSLRPGLGVYVIDGHSLSEDEVSLLENIVGVDRVAARGRVALGITGAAPQFGGFSGCLLAQVTPNSSADSAGLRGGDLITGLGDEPLRDFDDLVERLKVYDVGDTVNLTVRRGFQNFMYKGIFRHPQEPDYEMPKAEQVAVKLKGWAEFANPEPATDPEPATQDDPPAAEPIPEDTIQ